MVTDDWPAIKFFDLHQRLVKDSKSEGGLDPYPSKNILNFQTLLEPLAKFMSSLIKSVTRRR